MAIMITTSKKSLAAMAFAAALFSAWAFTAPTPVHTDSYKVDPAWSKVQWFAEKVTGKHQGEVAIKDGVIHHAHGNISGSVTIDMQSIVSTDLSGEYKSKLENHLKSDEFFASEKFPESKLDITSAVPVAGAKENEPNYTVSGNLIIKGISQPVSFPAIIRFDGHTLNASAELVIDRTKYDIRYGSKTFFADIGDKAISDNFTLKVELKGAI